MKERELTGFVIGRKKLGDGDLILTIYSKDLGKVSVVAKGIKKPRAKLQSLVEPLIESKYRIIGNGKLPVLVGVKSLSENRFFTASSEKNLSALLVTEILDKLTTEEMPNANLYSAYKQGLDFLLASGKDLLVVSYSILAILRASGLEPHIRPKSTGKLFFNLSEGTVSSEPSGQQSLTINSDTVKLWGICMNYNQSTVARVNVGYKTLADSVANLTSYIEYSTHKQIKSTKVLFESGSF